MKPTETDRALDQLAATLPNGGPLAEPLQCDRCGRIAPRGDYDVRLLVNGLGAVYGVQFPCACGTGEGRPFRVQ